MNQPGLTVPQALQLALIEHQGGHFPAAEALYRQILQADPNCADALNNLATLLHRKGEIGDAISCYRRALASGEDRAEVRFNLGDALCTVGRLEEAVQSFRRALALNPADAATHNHLGIALQSSERIDEAVACYQTAVALDGAYADAFNNLGAAFTLRGLPDEAIAALRRAIELRPGFAEAHANLGTALKAGGLIEEAIAAYRLALDLRPGFAQAHGHLLHTLYLDWRQSGAQILEAHRQWERQHVPAGIARRDHDNDRAPDRRLRIGYVSADFRNHVVGRFLLGLFENHDRGNFQIVCFSGVGAEDEMTRRLRACANEWHAVLGMSDDALAAMIRSAKIDILVDLSLHLADGRMLAFARKPAPVQICYLAYPGTTGLSAMDYRFTDALLDPPGQDEFCSERSVRLKSYWNYRPWEVNDRIDALPARSSGQVTLGCMNNFSKVSEPALRTWAAILREVDVARLLIQAPPGAHRQRVGRIMEEEKIDPARVEMIPTQPLPLYYQAYNRIDIALDPFPCCGGTTTCDALWMGVPVVTLAGQTAMGRGGVGLLHHAGVSDLAAQSPAEYVQIAAALARNLDRLEQLRRTLRPRMASSAICDAGAFARDVETHYRCLWQEWAGRGR